MTSLGRGRSHLTFLENKVIKLVDSPWEPRFMESFPDVFVPILDEQCIASRTEFTMLRGISAVSENILNMKGAASRVKLLWRHRWDGQMPDWRLRLRAHIFRVIASHRLNVSMVTLDNVIRMLPDVHEPVVIHGDATLANCVFMDYDQEGYKSYYPTGWYWIDPLTRPYIPGDRHVDFGKIFQSCLGYEAIISDKPHVYHTDLMVEILKQLDLDLKTGLLWCIIHLVRLIPYQEERHKATFEEQIRDVWSWI